MPLKLAICLVFGAKYGWINRILKASLNTIIRFFKNIYYTC